MTCAAFMHSLPLHSDILAQQNSLTSSSLLGSLWTPLGYLLQFSEQLFMSWLVCSGLGKHIWTSLIDHSCLSRSKPPDAIMDSLYVHLWSVLVYLTQGTLNFTDDRSAILGCSAHLSPPVPWANSASYWCIRCIPHLFWHHIWCYRHPICVRWPVGSIVCT